MKHGTESGYGHHRCRCAECTEAHRVYVSQWKLKAMENVPDHVHGTANGYLNYTCRCWRCTEAAVERVKVYKARKREGR